MLAPLLADAEHEVAGFDADLYRGCDFGSEPRGVAGRVGDVRDVRPDDLAGFDAIVHLAALSNDPLGSLDPALTLDVNAEGTLRVARAAHEAGVRRFIFASSCSMYGASGTEDALDESAPLRPLTAYAESKVRAEEGLFALAGPTSRRSRCATRPCSAPRPACGSTSCSTISSPGRTRPAASGSSATAAPWRPLVHVRDLAKTALALLEAPEERVRGEAFNVGTDDQNYLIRDLAQIVSRVTGCCRRDGPGILRGRPLLPCRLLEAPRGLSRAQPRLGRGARRTASSPTPIGAVGLTEADFEGDRYVRLRRLESLLAANELSSDLRRGAETTPAASA